MADQVPPTTNQPVSTPHQVQPPVALDRIHVTIRNRIRVIVDEEVKAVTSFNDTGRFDVLPTHSNFISVIKDQIILHKLDGQEQGVPVQNGVFKVKNGKVSCYIDLLIAKKKLK